MRRGVTLQTGLGTSCLAEEAVSDQLGFQVVHQRDRRGEVGGVCLSSGLTGADYVPLKRIR